eukprot:238008_1
MHLSHEEARYIIALVVAAAVPFILRSIVDWILSYIFKKCYKMEMKKLMSTAIIGTGDSNVTINKIFGQTFTWTDAYKDQGLNLCAAMTVSMIRLIFWHWMQPFIYCFVLYAYWDLLDHVQQILGLIVAGREVIYFFLTIIGLLVNPVYLLLDLRATWNVDKDPTSTILMYILAPEKYIYLSLVSEVENGTRAKCTYQYILVGLVIMDLCGIAAFIWALAVHNVYAPLMVGYIVTTLG